MRKILIFLLSTIMLLSVVACGKDDGKTTEQPTTTTAPTESVAPATEIAITEPATELPTEETTTAVAKKQASDLMGKTFNQPNLSATVISTIDMKMSMLGEEDLTKAFTESQLLVKREEDKTISRIKTVNTSDEEMDKTDVIYVYDNKTGMADEYTFSEGVWKQSETIEQKAPVFELDASLFTVNEKIVADNGNKFYEVKGDITFEQLSNLIGQIEDNISSFEMDKDATIKVTLLYEVETEQLVLVKFDMKDAFESVLQTLANTLLIEVPSSENGETTGTVPSLDIKVEVNSAEVVISDISVEPVEIEIPVVEDTTTIIINSYPIEPTDETTEQATGEDDSVYYTVSDELLRQFMDAVFAIEDDSEFGEYFEELRWLIGFDYKLVNVENLDNNNIRYTFVKDNTTAVFEYTDDGMKLVSVEH